ncbi:uncharacterized protein LOC143029454 [Oratosquilla oratoria]|uniref:uncharacterized protein LOC143029454 n=1 Tax=Oratosquilla oratoria TaxID=337810 RepID=UPI003F764CEB
MRLLLLGIISALSCTSLVFSFSKSLDHLYDLRRNLSRNLGSKLRATSLSKTTSQALNFDQDRPLLGVETLFSEAFKENKTSGSTQNDPEKNKASEETSASNQMDLTSTVPSLPSPSQRSTVETSTTGSGRNERVDILVKFLADLEGLQTEEDLQDDTEDFNFNYLKTSRNEIDNTPLLQDNDLLPVDLEGFPDSLDDPWVFMNNVGKAALQASKDVENMILSAMKLSGLSPQNLTDLRGPSMPLSDLLLDPIALEKIWSVVSSAPSEEKIMQGLARELLTPRAQYGSALTLDPVTIIALLTLAAYLIRAVYQILTVTGRSIDVVDMGFPLALSDLPEALTVVHNWLSDTDMEFARLGRDAYQGPSLLELPGSVAAVIKMKKEGHRACIRQFLCRDLSQRAYPTLTFNDLVIASLGHYYGEKDLSYYIDYVQDRPEACESFPHKCSSVTLDEVDRLRGLFSRAGEVFLDLTDSLRQRLSESKMSLSSSSVFSYFGW